MRRTHNIRTIRTIVGALALVALTGCGEAPLESVGERSGEWVGSLSNGVSLLPSEQYPRTVMATP